MSREMSKNQQARFARQAESARENREAREARRVKARQRASLLEIRDEEAMQIEAQVGLSYGIRVR